MHLRQNSNLVLCSHRDGNLLVMLQLLELPEQIYRYCDFILFIWTFVKSGRAIQESTSLAGCGLYMKGGWRGGVKIKGIDDVSETETHFVLISDYESTFFPHALE